MDTVGSLSTRRSLECFSSSHCTMAAMVLAPFVIVSPAFYTSLFDFETLNEIKLKISFNYLLLKVTTHPNLEIKIKEDR